ncbi:MAG: bifunctional nuclease family protein [Prevotella sp.]|nr:bifunctional nuclease family protein [Prevotella sp.]
MNRIRLIFRGVSEIVGTETVGLLVLVDENEQRQLAVTCDKDMLRQFEMRMQRQSIAGRLLPEVLWQAISLQTDLAFEIVIDSLIEGQYRSALYNIDTLEPIALRASDAILLSFIAHVPIYIEESLFLKQSIPYEQNTRSVALPVNTLSDKMLQDALAKAVASENYEMASYLRDELRRREMSRNISDEREKNIPETPTK